VHFDITKDFHSPTDALLLILENSKICIKTYIKTAPTCFGLGPSLGGLKLSLAKVTLTLKQSVKLRSYVLRGGVAACGNMWQHVAACDNMWQHVATCGSMWQHVAACGSMWQHVAACGNMWQHVAACGSMWQHVATCGNMWQHAQQAQL
jgi:hypothetical protein